MSPVSRGLCVNTLFRCLAPCYLLVVEKKDTYEKSFSVMSTCGLPQWKKEKDIYDIICFCTIFHSSYIFLHRVFWFTFATPAASTTNITYQPPATAQPHIRYSDSKIQVGEAPGSLETTHRRCGPSAVFSSKENNHGYYTLED